MTQQLSADEAARIAEIEASLAEDARLSEEMETLYRLPIHDMVGAAEERNAEYRQLQLRRSDARGRYRTYVPFLLGIIARLTASAGADGAGEEAS